ncbi:hypothetical protein CANCADRAFT_42620 [Tortispora caseinolytica NRRL Y-17796]|uniref:Xylanolytic transcriptional activator regulatory domain-containing protein n=1 Tax=Tortispora caseinolytica NRRL Y-17796 TaxID=767744 RepID=A0A1E4TJS2_9ASCO|nr:hypothetical protein CANCADRAFT_42620 [Tortispora caseinolytica NRRL Y-17796]
MPDGTNPSIWFSTSAPDQPQTDGDPEWAALISSQTSTMRHLSPVSLPKHTHTASQPSVSSFSRQNIATSQSSPSNSSQQSNGRPIIAILPEPVCILPDKLLILQLAQDFFQSYHQTLLFSLHPSTLLQYIQSPAFDPKSFMFVDPSVATSDRSSLTPSPLLIVALVAISAHKSQHIVNNYGLFSEAHHPERFLPGDDNAARQRLKNFHPTAFNGPPTANRAASYFEYHAHLLIAKSLDKPSVRSIQALTILALHHWNRGNVTRATIYLGIASRMASALKLFSTFANERMTDHIVSEMTRRTVWSLLMVDRCMSSSPSRLPIIDTRRVKTLLPLSEDAYASAIKSTQLALPQLIAALFTNQLSPQDTNVFAQTSLNGFKVALLEIWSRVSEYVAINNPDDFYEKPMDTTSDFHILDRALDRWIAHLPSQFQYSNTTLAALYSAGKGLHYAYIHLLYFTCLILLCRLQIYEPSLRLPQVWLERSHSRLIESLLAGGRILSTIAGHQISAIDPLIAFSAFVVGAVSRTCSLHLDWLQAAFRVDVEHETMQFHEPLSDFTYNYMQTQGYQMMMQSHSSPADSQMLCNALWQQYDSSLSYLRMWSPTVEAASNMLQTLQNVDFGESIVFDLYIYDSHIEKPEENPFKGNDATARTIDLAKSPSSIQGFSFSRLTYRPRDVLHDPHDYGNHASNGNEPSGSNIDHVEDHDYGHMIDRNFTATPPPHFSDPLNKTGSVRTNWTTEMASGISGNKAKAAMDAVNSLSAILGSKYTVPGPKELSEFLDGDTSS